MKIEITKKDPKNLISDHDRILIAIKFPNLNCRTVTVGYYRNGKFYDSLSNALYFDDGFEAREISSQFVEWYAELPSFEYLNQ